MKVHKHLASQAVEAVFQIFSTHQYADKVIEKYLKLHKKWGARDRKFFAESVYEMVRWWRYLWALVGEEPQVDAQKIWKIWGAWWIIQGHELPDFDEVKKMNVKFILDNKNKKFSRAIQHSIPDWLDDLGQKELGARWSEILPSLNHKAEVYLRVNRLKTTPEYLIEALSQEEIYAEKITGLPDALKLKERKNVFITKAFKAGLFEVQDAASQFVAPLLDPQPGMRVIDACAGAGGKALHLSALMKNKGKIIAMDIHDWKLGELKTRAARNGVDIIETKVIDSSKVIKRQHETADRLLLDVPCSGLGVLRRNPDTKWKLSKEELTRLQEIQQNLLNQYSPMVKKNGQMVYATCSILPSENENQVSKFLAENKDWALVKDLRMDPDVLGYDGFYAALLKRNA